MSKALWFLKQALPLTYVSQYAEGGKAMVSVWKMWLGRSYQIRSWEVISPA